MKKKLDNRGFAITTIIFGTLILFMLLLVSLLAILALYRKNLDKLVDDKNSVHGSRNIATLIPNSDFDTIDDLKNFDGRKSGLYCFSDGCRYVSRSELYPNETGIEDSYEFAFSGGSNDETGDCEPFTARYGGYYYVELCGAEGGSAVDKDGKVVAIGGKGACTSGYINLSAGDVLYACVGGAGKTTDFKKQVSVTGGFNGGGNASSGTSMSVGSGGGATDIRLVNGKWNDASSLNSRIMVAAGGGGGYYGSRVSAGGGGGNIYGVDGSAGKGGTQIAGGTGSAKGSFGQGAGGGGAGGGGYYGGGSGSTAYGSGAGGSSFISGYAGVNAVTSLNNSKPSNNTVHYSGRYFVKAAIVSASHSGNGSAKIQFYGVNPPEKLHQQLNSIRYIRDCISGSNTRKLHTYDNNYLNSAEYNLWIEIQAIDSNGGMDIAKGKNVTGTSPESYAGNYAKIVDGDIENKMSIYCPSICSYSFPNVGQSMNNGQQCVTVDLGKQYNLEEISIWHYFDSGLVNGSIGSITYNDNFAYISKDGSSWIPIVDKSKVENPNGRRVSSYSSIDVQKYIDVGKYTGKLEFIYNGVSTIRENTNIQIKEGETLTDWKIKFLSSGTLTMYDNYNIDAFIVGGGGGGTGCARDAVGGGWYWGTYYGGGGYHSVFSTTIENNKEYELVVGEWGHDTIAFDQTAAHGTNAGCGSSGTGGKAVGEFETKGKDYSGTQSGSANSGKSGSAGIIIIRPNNS